MELHVCYQRGCINLGQTRMPRKALHLGMVSGVHRNSPWSPPNSILAWSSGDHGESRHVTFQREAIYKLVISHWRVWLPWATIWPFPPRTLHAKYSKSSHNRTLVPGFGFGIYDLFTMGPRRSTPRRLLILLLSLDGASHGLCLSSSIGKPRLARAPEPEAAGRMCPALGPLPHAAHLKSPKAQHKDFMGLKLGNDKMPHESCCNVWWSGRPISEQ